MDSLFGVAALPASESVFRLSSLQEVACLPNLSWQVECTFLRSLSLPISFSALAIAKKALMEGTLRPLTAWVIATIWRMRYDSERA
jgi:hypothetical protein